MIELEPISRVGQAEARADSSVNPVQDHGHTGLDSRQISYDDLLDTPAAASTSKEVYIPAEAMNPTTTGGCRDLTRVEEATNDVDYWVLDFDDTADESCFFTLRMPDDWDAGTLTFRFIWSPLSSVSGTVAWGIKGRAFADGDTPDQAYGTEVETTDTRIAGSTPVHISDESSAVTLAGTLAAGQWAQFKITRKTGSDTLSTDARLMGVRLKYSIT